MQAKQPTATYNYRAPSGISMRMKPVPPKRSGHVLVRIRAAGVNPVDAKFVAGDKFPECCLPFWTRDWRVLNSKRRHGKSSGRLRRGVKPQLKEDCILPFNETGAQRAFRCLNPPPGERRKVAGKIVLDLNAGDGDGIDDKFNFLFSEDSKKNK